MRYFYRITPSFEKGQQLLRFLHSCQKAEEASENYARKFGAVAFHTHPSALAGGISYLEFEKENEVDVRTWRQVAVLDGQACYEPNVMQLEGVMVAKDKFRPSNTARKVFSKLPRKWNQVRPLKTLQEWAKLIGYTMTDDMEQDARFVHEQLKDTLFWHFIEFAGFGVATDHNKKGKNPLYAKRAITAAVEAQKLPVVFPDSLYKLLEVDMSQEDESDAEPSTPQFFYRERKGEWYVALDMQINTDDAEHISEQTFIASMNMALRESKEKPVTCLD